MRVLMVHNTGSRDVPSGERIVFEQEARALRQLNFDVVQQVVDNESLRGNVFCRLAAGAEAIWSVPAYCQMLSSLHQLNPDIIHVHNIFPRLSGSIFAACARLHIPVVQTLHNYRYLCVEGGFFRANQVCQACLHGQSWNGVRYRCTSGSRTASAALTAHNLWHVRSGRLWSRVDRFIAVSEYVKRQHVSAGFPESSLVVKYHGVEAGTGVIQRGSPDTNAHDITFAGRLCAAKGTSILRELPPLLRPFKLQIVGTGPDETPLRAHFAASEMDNVTFAGAQSPAEVRRRISASRCVIVPSLCPESFGLVLAEAMACGVPVVASNVGALPELVGKSGGGLIVDPQDGATAFAQAVRHLLDQPRFARDLGERGREFARRELSLDQSVTRLVEIYRDVVMARRDKAMKS